MPRKTTTTTITIEVREDETDQIRELTASLPLATRHGVARAALVVGLRALAAQPEALARLLVSLRRNERRVETT